MYKKEKNRRIKRASGRVGNIDTPPFSELSGHERALPRYVTSEYHRL